MTLEKWGHPWSLSEGGLAKRIGNRLSGQTTGLEPGSLWKTDIAHTGTYWWIAFIVGLSVGIISVVTARMQTNYVSVLTPGVAETHQGHAVVTVHRRTAGGGRE